MKIKRFHPCAVLLMYLFIYLFSSTVWAQTLSDTDLQQSDRLCVAHVDLPHAKSEQSLDMVQLRQKIKDVDAEIIASLAERSALCQKIGKIKQKTHQAIYDPRREADLMRYYVQQSQLYGLDSRYITPIFSRIMAYCKQVQARKS